MAGAVWDNTDPYHPFSFILPMADIVQWGIDRIPTTMIHFFGRRMFVWGQGPNDFGTMMCNRDWSRRYIKKRVEMVSTLSPPSVDSGGDPVQGLPRLDP